MAGETWILLAEAAKFLGKKDVPRRINGAGMRGTRVGESTPVEIPASEVAGLRIDWVRSSLMLGRLCTMYQSVQMRWADVKRLAQADVERLARAASEAATSAAPPKQGPQSQAHPAHGAAAEAEREKSVTLAEAVASELSRLYPVRRPAKQRNELLKDVRSAAGEKLGVFGLTTLDRAMRSLGWTTRRPKGTKAPQPSR